MYKKIIIIIAIFIVGLLCINVSGKNILFKHKNADTMIRKLQSDIQAPYVNVQYSCVTNNNTEQKMILIQLSLDAQGQWVSGYYSSRYLTFELLNTGDLNLISEGFYHNTTFSNNNFTKVKDVADYINIFLLSISQ